MYHKRLWHALSLVILFAMVLTACGGTVPVTVAPTAEPIKEATIVPPTVAAPTAESPTELRVAALLSSGPDNPWDKSFLLSFQNVQQAAPHGLVIADLAYSDGVWGDDAEVVLREYAASGNYDIIWAHSAYSDQVKNLKDEFPDIMWVVTGSGNEGMGGNAYWLFLHLHEVAYLMGRLAGGLTQTNVIGNIAGYATDDTNDVMNGFVDGAKAVNPDIKVKVSFIESWYDPAKAAEAATAQIAAGADQLYMNSFGYEPCTAAGIYCYGTYEDLNYLAPTSILTSAIAYWEPHINYAIDEWWKHETEGTPYNAPMDPVWFSMAQGTGDLAPFHGLDAQVPPEVIADVMQARQDILDGKLIIELKLVPVETN